MGLHCPHCGEDLTDAPTSLGDRCCGHCGAKASDRRCHLALSRAQRAQRPLAELPEGVVLTEDDFRFRIRLTTFDEVGSVCCWLVSAVMTLAGVINLTRYEMSSQEMLLGLGIFAAVVLPLVGAAAWLTWGHKAIEGTAEQFVLSSGIGRWVRRRTYARGDIRSVALLRRDGQDSEGHRTIDFAVVLAFADGTEAVFGAGQPYPRLEWTARYLNEAA